MNMSVTYTKILPPRRRPDYLSRQRLLSLLRDLLDHRLVIVAAPAGYGKTTLLVDLTEALEWPVCWYSLDPLDKDPQRFISHLIGSINHCFPQFGGQSRAVLEASLSVAQNLDRIVTSLVNEIYEKIQQQFVLILDDLHLVDDNEDVSHFLSQFLQHAGDNCHVIVASRSLLTLPDLPLMVARSQVGGLGFEELAFRQEEIQSLALQNYHHSMPDEVAAELAAETEGWITGLLLSAQTMWQGMVDRLRLARVSGVGLYDYLAQQVLEQQSLPMREFLLRTSLLEEFNAEMCQEILGPLAVRGEQSWQRLMDKVMQNNLFIIPVGDAGAWVRYHQLFRDFLQLSFTEERPEEAAAIRRRLAEWYAMRAEWEKAHDQYQRLGDMTGTADLIEQAGPSLIRNGRLAILGEWLTALPPTIRSSRSGLLALSGGVAVMQGQVEQGLSQLNQAESLSRAAGDVPRLARTLAWRAVAHRFMANYHGSKADADEALALTERDPVQQALYADALRARGMSLYHLGQLNEAIDWLSRSLQMYSDLRDEQRAAMLLMELGAVYVATGRHDRARAHYEQALNYWRGVENVIQRVPVLNNLGVLFHLQGKYERALALLEEAVDCAEQSGYARAEGSALAGIGDLYADVDAPDAAREAYLQARNIAAGIDDPYLLLYLDLAEAALARTDAELASAHVLIAQAEERAHNSESVLEQGLVDMVAGQLFLRQDRIPEAVERLRKAFARFDIGEQPVEGARAALYLAMAYQGQKRASAAIIHLSRAFELASTLASEHTLVVPGRQTLPLLEAAVQDASIGAQAGRLRQQVLAFQQAMPALRRRLRSQAVVVPFSAPLLSIHALGSVQVLVERRVLATSDWQTQAARDLLFCLLAHPNGLTREQIGEMLWGIDSSAQTNSNFKKTIYRLRRAVGQEVVVLDDERYRFNWEYDYQYDVEEFQRHARSVQAGDDASEQLAIYERAISLYQGPYLPGVDGDWVWPQRESLWQQYTGLVLGLARHYLEVKNYRAAVTYCQRALAEDPCLEEAHRLAMRAHAALGNRSDVARQFERCRLALHKFINVPPSPQTRHLYDTLMR
jgi:LuxR family transcriptional regulator, maltose regulon positive regulatory protein